MTRRTWRDLRTERSADDPEFARGVARERELLDLQQALYDLRHARGVTQAQVAAAMGVSRPNVARIEKEVDVRASTLQAYVRALGGELRVAAVFPDGTEHALAGTSEPQQPHAAPIVQEMLQTMEALRDQILVASESIMEARPGAASNADETRSPAGR